MATSDSTTLFDETQLNNEEWRDIPEYEGTYQVSNLGQIRRIKEIRQFKKRIMKLTLGPDGYLRIGLCKNGKQKVFTVHKLVFLLFHGDYQYPKFEINHINGIKTDNRIDNLELLTHQQNIQHAFDNNLVKPSCGEGKYNAKLNWRSVDEIRKLHSEGIGQNELAKRFNVSTANIYYIVREISWPDRSRPKG